MESSASEDEFNLIHQIVDILDAMSDASEPSSSDNSDSETIDNQKCSNFVEIIDLFNDEVFKSHMRIKRSTVDYLISMFSKSSFSLDDSQADRPKISSKSLIFMYVWYISNSITYRELANLFGVTESFAYKSVRSVTHWLITMGREFVKWPEDEALQETSQKFDKMPGVIGVIGCTRFNISVPIVSIERYLNREQYSLALQAVVDADKKFINISCVEPGSLHDSRVLRKSDLFRKVEENHQQMFPNNTFIIGDSAYFASSWLMPPFKDNGNLSEIQRKFNVLHSSAYVVLENVFELLKSRFRKLLKLSEHENVAEVSNLIVSACVLHNICIIKDDLFKDNEVILSETSEDSSPEELFLGKQENRRVILFNHLLERNII